MTCPTAVSKDVNQRSPSARLVDAQNAQIWTASVVIGIEPKSTQIGGSRSPWGCGPLAPRAREG